MFYASVLFVPFLGLTRLVRACQRDSGTWGMVGSEVKKGKGESVARVLMH